MLDAAMLEFWSHGYDATSISDLVKATGLSRGSLYSAYDDKRTLFCAALEHYDKNFRENFLGQLGRRYEPRQAIIELFKAAAGQCGEGEYPAGCLLVNTALELSPHDPEICAFVAKCFREVEGFFFEKIKLSRKLDQHTGSGDARQKAKALLTLLLGLRVLTRSGADPETLNAVVSQAEAVLD
ncbi:MAG: TetR/AcrR family transcriptional regulator [Alphaproteobacteria bacterium]|nr:TetR/AcrR family transcriptional regulator [Alphaproteobacteria bacterium]